MAVFLPLGFQQLVVLQAAKAQAAAGRVLNVGTGSLLNAWFEASATVGGWVQVLLLQVRDQSRLATSVGPQVDTFVGDWAFAREPAVSAGGTVTMGRLSATGSAVVPVGGSVGTATDIVLDYTITADTSHPAYDAAVNQGGGGYVLLPNVYTVDVPVACQTAGAAGNVSAGLVTLLRSAMAGIDTVTNALAMTGGADAESDVSVRQRFVLYIASLSRATRIAIEAAVAGVQQGLTYAVQENVDSAGVFKPGHFTVTVDDGTGSPSADLLARVYKAVEAVRAFTVSFSVHGPQVVQANIVLTITVGAGGDKTALSIQVRDAIAAYVRGLGVGATLPFSKVASIAYRVDDAITNVSGVSLNATTADLVPTELQVVKPGVVMVS